MGLLCSGKNDQRGLPSPWSMWFKEDADLFHDEPWLMFPKVNVVKGRPTKSIPVVDGRIDHCPEVEWVGLRTAQVFDTKRRGAGWKTMSDLRKCLEIPDHCKIYFIGTGKDDQLYYLSKQPDWARRLKDYGVDYASPLDWSMYNNSTACQVVWSQLKSWESAAQLSDAGLLVIPNVGGPPQIQAAQANWLKLIGAEVVMTNFQMIYNKYAFAREIEPLKGFVNEFSFAHVILNGVTHPDRLQALKEVYPFTFMSSVVYTNALYRKMWSRQTGWERCPSANSVQHVMDLFRANFVLWDELAREVVHG